jgi:hypothetical protein
VAVRNRSTEKGDEPTTYQLRFLEHPVSRFETPPPLNLAQGRVPDLDSQHTGKQHTARQQVEISKGPTVFEKYDQARLAILPYAQDLAREMNDQAPLTSTTTRLTNLYRDSGLPLADFLDLVIAARAITQERTGSIRTRSDGLGPKPKMAYWFTVLEDLIGQTHAATGTGDG